MGIFSFFSRSSSGEKQQSLYFKAIKKKDAKSTR